jgi:hypothetical protein
MPVQACIALYMWDKSRRLQWTGWIRMKRHITQITKRGWWLFELSPKTRFITENIHSPNIGDPLREDQQQTLAARQSMFGLLNILHSWLVDMNILHCWPVEMNILHSWLVEKWKITNIGVVVVKFRFIENRHQARPFCDSDSFSWSPCRSTFLSHNKHTRRGGWTSLEEPLKGG